MIEVGSVQNASAMYVVTEKYMKIKMIYLKDITEHSKCDTISLAQDKIYNT